MLFVANSFGRTFHTLAHLDIKDFRNVAVLHFGVMNFKQSGLVDRVALSSLTTGGRTSSWMFITPFIFRSKTFTSKTSDQGIRAE